MIQVGRNAADDESQGRVLSDTDAGGGGGKRRKTGGDASGGRRESW